MAEIKYINSQELQKLYDNPNLIIYDIREADEYRREHIVGAKNTPLSNFNLDQINEVSPNSSIVFHCQSGNRTKMNEAKFKDLPCKEVFILKDGITEWKNLGCATAVDNNAPLPIMRQVQITAGSLVVFGVILSFIISPYFALLSAFVGAGLIFAGISGFCGMANLLMLLPYNKNNNCNTTCNK